MEGILKLNTSKQIETETLKDTLFVNDTGHVPDELLQDEYRRAVRSLVNSITDESCANKRTQLSVQRIADCICRLSPDSPRPSGEPEAILVLARKYLQQQPTGTRSVVIPIPHHPPSIQRSDTVHSILCQAAQLLSAADNRGDLIMLIAHGSLSTEDRTEFSDLDFLAVFRDSCFDTVDSVRLLQHEVFEFNKFVRLMDPLSHHGLNILSESDLRSYDESFLPTRQLCLSSRIQGPNQIILGLRSCRVESGRQLLRHALAIREKPSSSYSTKLYLARIHLIPAVYLQCVHGLYIDKKMAIDMASSIFPSQQLAAIQTASTLRENWCRRNPLNSLPSQLIRSAFHLGNFCLMKLNAVAQLLVEADSLQAK